ncbi:MULTISPECIES: PIN domain-containing protein [Acetobacter]|nr:MULTISPECIES: PIN domain-containing protein [Acetobacter]
MNIIVNKPKYTSGSELITAQPLFVLIDYENVQTEDLSYLNQPHMHVLLFVGTLQKKISMKLAVEMQALGSRAQYIQLEGTGQNALDMCIAHHTGFILASMPTARFLSYPKTRDMIPSSSFWPIVTFPLSAVLSYHHLYHPKESALSNKQRLINMETSKNSLFMRLSM